MRVLPLVVVLVLLTVGTAWAETEGLDEPVPPLSSASVHDPSVIKVGDTY